MTFWKATIYIFIQLFASIFAALVVALIMPYETETSFLLSFPQPHELMEDYQIFILEFIFSFAYVGMYYGLVWNKEAPSNVFGFGIGGVILIAHLTIGLLSGACVNPIRYIGPALLSEKIDYMGIFCIS